MEIVTISRLDEWVETHVARFIALARQTNPEHRYSIVVPMDGTEDRQFAEEREMFLFDNFATVKLVDMEFVNGRLAYYDRLRAGLTKLLGVDSCLYMDPDIDVVGHALCNTEQLMGQDIAWVANSTHMECVTQALTQAKLRDNRPHMEPGMIWLAKDFTAAFDRLYENVDQDSFAPGMATWNLLIRQDWIQDTQLPTWFNVTSVAPEKFAHPDTQTIHFTGPVAKSWRPYLMHEFYHGGRSIRFTDKPVWYKG